MSTTTTLIRMAKAELSPARLSKMLFEVAATPRRCKEEEEDDF